MKFDQDKPIARGFYWKGLALVVDDPLLKDVIGTYGAFSEEPSLTLLVPVFVALRAYMKLRGDSPLEVMRVCEHGAKKYASRNYLGLTLDRIIDAAGRHLNEMAHDHFIDASTHPHSAHLMANILIAAELLDK